MKNDKLQHDVLITILKAIIVILVVCSFALCWTLYYSKVTKIPYYFKGNVVIVFVYFVIYLLFCRVYESLQISMVRVGEIAYNQTLSVALSDFFIYLIICLLAKGMPNLLPGLLCFVVQVVLCALWAIVSNKVYFNIFPPRKTIIVYDTREGMERLVEQYGLSVA